MNNTSKMGTLIYICVFSSVECLLVFYSEGFSQMEFPGKDPPYEDTELLH